MYRLKATFIDNGVSKENFSLWYFSSNDAYKKGIKNFKGLYVEKLLNSDKATITLETHHKKNVYYLVK